MSVGWFLLPLLILGILTIGTVIANGKYKTPEEQSREDEEQMKFLNRWNQNHPKS